MRDLTAVCLVTCNCYGAENDGPETWQVVVPERLLWSGDGLAELFRICRSFLVDPAEHATDPESKKVEERWDSFHIVKIDEMEGFMPDIEWNDHEDPEK